MTDLRRTQSAGGDGGGSEWWSGGEGRERRAPADGTRILDVYPGSGMILVSSNANCVSLDE